MNIRAHWEAELKAGVNGQDRMISSTWVMDGLYFAACYETNAAEFDAEAERCRRGTERNAAVGYRIWREAADEERSKAAKALADSLERAA